MHVHVQSERGEAKFWLEPIIELAQNYGMGSREIRTAQKLVEENHEEIRNAWRRRFSR